MAESFEAKRGGVHDAPDLSLSIKHLNLARPTFNSLWRNGIQTIEQLTKCTSEDLLEIKHFGPAHLTEVRTQLAKRGLTLLEQHPGSRDPNGSISALNLSTATCIVLAHADIHMIRVLTRHTPEDLLRIRNLGATRLGEVKAKLAELGLSLREGLSEPVRLDSPIRRLNLPLGLIDRLRHDEIATVEDLTLRTASGLLGIQKVGPRSLDQVRAQLAAHGFALWGE